MKDWIKWLSREIQAGSIRGVICGTTGAGSVGQWLFLQRSTWFIFKDAAFMGHIVFISCYTKVNSELHLFPHSVLEMFYSPCLIFLSLTNWTFEIQNYESNVSIRTCDFSTVKQVMLHFETDSVQWAAPWGKTAKQPLVHIRGPLAIRRAPCPSCCLQLEMLNNSNSKSQNWPQTIYI